MEPSANHVLLEGIVNHGFSQEIVRLIENSDCEDLDDDRDIIDFLECFCEYAKNIIENSRSRK